MLSVFISYGHGNLELDARMLTLLYGFDGHGRGCSENDDVVGKPEKVNEQERRIDSVGKRGAYA